MAGVLTGDRKERRPREDRGEGWSDVVTSQGAPRIAINQT